MFLTPKPPLDCKATWKPFRSSSLGQQVIYHIYQAGCFQLQEIENRIENALKNRETDWLTPQKAQRSGGTQGSINTWLRHFFL